MKFAKHNLDKFRREATIVLESATMLTNEKTASPYCPDFSKWLCPLVVIHFDPTSNEETVHSFTEATLKKVKLYADTWSKFKCVQGDVARISSARLESQVGR